MLLSSANLLQIRCNGKRNRLSRENLKLEVLINIGQTGRSLDHRLCEHCRALKNRDVAASAIAEHVFSANHQVDLSKATVIDAHPHTQTRCMLESWHNQHHQATLNRGKGTMPELYASLLDWPFFLLFIWFICIVIFQFFCHFPCLLHLHASRDHLIVCLPSLYLYILVCKYQ